MSGEEALQLGVAALFGAAGEAALLHPSVAASPGSQALMVVALPLLGFAFARGAQRLLAPRTALMVKGYAKAFDGNADKVKDHAERHKDDANYHETMFRTFKAMADAAEPEVIETLGYLAGVYSAAGKRPNAFFRGLGRILCDLEEGELQQLRELLSVVGVVHQQHGVAGTELHLTFGRMDEPEDANVWVIIPGQEQPIAVAREGIRHCVRLFTLLKRELFARSPQVGTFGSYYSDGSKQFEAPDGERAALIPFETATHLLQFLDPQPWAT